MPQAVSEVSSGAQFSRNATENGIADAQTRTFKIVLQSPGEYVDLQKECGVYIGDAHPSNRNIYCQSFDGRYDGDSRMVVVVTFNYGTKPASSDGGLEAGSIPPDIRPANWTTSVATYESPVRTWRKVINGAALAAGAAENPVGDMYDGIVKLEPIVTISITQFEQFDPLGNVDAVGCINSKEITCGSKKFPVAHVMLRSIQSSPVIEPFGSRLYRGWTATYEFLFKRNPAYICGTNAFGQNDYLEDDIGWDVAVPQTGFNVKTFTPPGSATQDDYGQPLKHTNGKIVDPLSLPVGMAAGTKARAMIKVFEYENGGASQLPSAQPIALNDDGTPRAEDADPKVLVYRYRVYKEFDFNTLRLRLT